MKKPLFYLTVVLVQFAVLALNNSVYAYDGQVNLHGNITPPTCRVNNGQGAISVALPTVSSSVLNASGKTAGAVQFIIQLSDCDDVPQVGAFFENSSNVSLADGRLVNTVNQQSNVQLELLNRNSETISLGKGQAEQNIQYFDVKNGSAQLAYKVRYYATGQAVPGVVKSSTTFLLVYP